MDGLCCYDNGIQIWLNSAKIVLQVATTGHAVYCVVSWKYLFPLLVKGRICVFYVNKSLFMLHGEYKVEDIHAVGNSFYRAVPRTQSAYTADTTFIYVPWPYQHEVPIRHILSHYIIIASCLSWVTWYKFRPVVDRAFDDTYISSPMPGAITRSW